MPVGVLAAGTVVVVALVIAAVVLFSGGDDDPGEAVEVPAATVASFERLCVDGGAPADLCRCAVDDALENLSPAEFIAAEEELRRDGDSLTPAMTAVFLDCEDRLGV